MGTGRNLVPKPAGIARKSGMLEAPLRGREMPEIA